MGSVFNIAETINQFFNRFYFNYPLLIIQNQLLLKNILNFILILIKLNMILSLLTVL